MEQEPIAPETNDQSPESRGGVEISAGELVERCGEYLDPEADVPFINEEVADLEPEAAFDFVLDYAATAIAMRGEDPEAVFGELGLLYIDE